MRAAGSEQADQHDFVITPQDTALFWVYDPVPCDLTALGGPPGRRAARRRDPGDRHRDRASGSSSGGPATTSRRTSRTRRCPQGDSAHLPYDYFHANSVGLAADGNIIVSARHTWTTLQDQSQDRRGDLAARRQEVRLHRSTRRPSSPGSTTSGSGGTARTACSTTAPASPSERDYSRGLVFKLDEAAKTGTFVRRIRAPGEALGADPGQLPGAGRRRVVHRLGADAVLHRAQRRRDGAAGRAPAARTTSRTGRTRRSGPGSRWTSRPWACTSTTATWSSARAGTAARRWRSGGPGPAPSRARSRRRPRPTAPASRPP